MEVREARTAFQLNFFTQVTIGIGFLLRFRLLDVARSMCKSPLVFKMVPPGMFSYSCWGKKRCFLEVASFRNDLPFDIVKQAFLTRIETEGWTKVIAWCT